MNLSSKSSDFFGWKFWMVLGELDADWVIEIELQSGQMRVCVLRENWLAYSTVYAATRRVIVIVMGNPGVSQGYPYPYPRQPIPTNKGRGYGGLG